MEKTFTAPLAVIMINGKKVGKIRNLTFTENIQRGEVQGIGSLTLQEVPAVAMRCQFQASSYMINLKTFGTENDPFVAQNLKSVQELVNTLLLGEAPVTIAVYKKTSGSVNNEGIVTSEGALERIGIANDCYLDSRSFEISEGNISGKNISGRYLTPMFLI